MIAGDQIPLYFQLFDYDDTKFVRVYVRDDAGDEIADSPFDLELVNLGLYSSLEALFPAGTRFVTCQYVVYDDSDYEDVSQSQGGGLDNFFADSEQDSSYPPSAAVGVFDGLPPDPNPQIFLVRGSDRSLVVRLVRVDTGDPLDISGATEVEFRFLNEDSTVLSLKLTDPGDPVTIVSEEAGRVKCDLSAAETTDLMIQSPAAFTVVVTLPTGKIAVNFPYQMAIVEESV